MTGITLYGLKNCDTCRKAIKTLEAAGQSVTFVDIRAEADLETLLPAWLAALDPSDLMNTRSTTWRQLDEADRARASADPKATLLLHPTLIKRPVIEANGEIYVGWTKGVQVALGLAA